MVHALIDDVDLRGLDLRPWRKSNYSVRKATSGSISVARLAGT